MGIYASDNIFGIQIYTNTVDSEHNNFTTTNILFEKIYNNNDVKLLVKWLINGEVM